MATRQFRPSRHRRPGVVSADAVVQQAKQVAAARAHGYREQSLKIHGWICAKCAREFEASNLHLLTVHHKDGNPRNRFPFEYPSPDYLRVVLGISYLGAGRHSRNRPSSLFAGEREAKTQDISGANGLQIGSSP